MPVIYYPAIIDRTPNGFYGITFPDFPGCVSAGATVQETARKGEEALAAHVSFMMRDGDPVPEPTPMDAIKMDPEEGDVACLLVRLELPGKVVRFNATMDEGLLVAVDQAAKQRGMTRSGFLADAVRHSLGR